MSNIVWTLSRDACLLDGKLFNDLFSSRALKRIAHINRDYNAVEVLESIRRITVISFGDFPNSFEKSDLYPEEIHAIYNGGEDFFVTDRSKP